MCTARCRRLLPRESWELAVLLQWLAALDCASNRTRQIPSRAPAPHATEVELILCLNRQHQSTSVILIAMKFVRPVDFRFPPMPTSLRIVAYGPT